MLVKSSNLKPKTLTGLEMTCIAKFKFFPAFLLFVVCTTAIAEVAPIGLHLLEGATYKWISVNEGGTEKALEKQYTKIVTPLEMTVLKRVADATLVELKYGKSEIAAPLNNLQLQKLIDDFYAITQSLKFRIVLNEYGQIEDLQNFEEIKSVVLGILDKLDESSKASEAVKQKAREMFNSKEVVASSLLREVPLLFFAAASTPDTKTPLQFETEMPNPFGGAPIKASGVTTFSRLAGNKKLLKIEKRQRLNPDSVREMVVQLNTKKMTKIQESDMKRQMKSLDIQDSIVATVDTTTGLSNEVRFTRITIVEGTKKVDSRSFSRSQ